MNNHLKEEEEQGGDEDKRWPLIQQETHKRKQKRFCSLRILREGNGFYPVYDKEEGEWRSDDDKEDGQPMQQPRHQPPGDGDYQNDGDGDNDGKEDRQFMQEPCHQPPGGHHGASFMKNF